MNSNQTFEKTNPQSFITKRCLFAVGCATLAQFIVFIAYFIIFGQCYYYDKNEEMSSLHRWFIILALNAAAFCQNMLWIRRYIKEQVTPTSKTPFQKFIQMFSYYNVMIMLLYAFIGILYSSLVILFYNVKGRSSLFLIEHKIFFILYGFSVSIVTLFKTKHKRRYMIFPLFQQRTVLVLKKKMLNVIINSLSTSFTFLYNFIIAYFILIVFLKLADLTAIKYLDVQTYLTITFILFIVGAFHLLSFNLLIMFCEVVLTRPHEFSLSLTDLSDDLNLFKAYKVNTYVLQHLVAYDLYQLSLYSTDRRKILFSISQPGGHPINWRKFIDEIFLTVVTFTTETNKLIDAYLNPIIEEVSTPPKLDNINFKTLRNLCLHSESSLFMVNTPVTVTAKPLGLKFAQKIGLNFLFSPDPAADIKMHLTRGQLIVWHLQTLVNLVVTSLKEDQCGIVQNDIKFIFKSLVELKTCTEKLNRLMFINKSSYYCNMKFSVQSAVRRALYKIFIEFSPYIDDLEISKETLNYLSSSIK